MHVALSLLPMTVSAPADSTAFEELVVRHQAQVLGATLSVLGDRARAEEIAQEAFLVAWHKLEGGARITNRAAWVCEIARNLARNARRRVREAPSLELEAVADAPSALDVLVERERDMGVQRALASLPEKYREPLVLFYVGGESVREVADALALNEAAVRKRLDRGREQVRAELAQVESSLRRQRPGAAFTALVLAAWATRARRAAAAVGMGAGLKVAAAVVLSLTATATAAVLVGQRSAAPTKAAVATRVIAPGADAAPSLAAARQTAVAPGARGPQASRGSQVELPEPEGMERKLDLEVNTMSAGFVFTLIGEITEVPVVVGPGVDTTALLNVKENNRPALEMFDEFLAQDGAARTEKVILTIGRGLGPTTLDEGATFDLDLDGMLLEGAVAAIAARLGEPIFLPGSVAKTPVHGKLVGVTAQGALETILAPVQMGFARKPGYLVTPDEP